MKTLIATDRSQEATTVLRTARRLLRNQGAEMFDGGRQVLATEEIEVEAQL
jgi:hypothetical protein